MFGPMMYLIPWLVSFSALVTEIFGSFLSSSATISILYFLPPISTPPLALYMSAVVSAQYLLTSPHDAASPDMTPLTPIFSTSCAAALAAITLSVVPTIALKTVVHGCNPRFGPVSIEGFYDEAISGLGVIDEVRRSADAGYDAYVIACFGDPGLYAAREVATGPVVGIAEAAFHFASLLAPSFSIV